MKALYNKYLVMSINYQDISEQDLPEADFVLVCLDAEKRLGANTRAIVGVSSPVDNSTNPVLNVLCMCSRYDIAIEIADRLCMGDGE